jgi:hypothetical protein
MSDQYDLAYVPATVESVLDHLEGVYDKLSDTNPKFTYLVVQIEKGVKSKEEVAILFLSGHMQQVFKFGLRETNAQDPARLEEDGIYLCGPDDFRDLRGVDRLVLAADIPPAYANYYLSPNVDELDLLIYGSSKTSLISGWVAEQVDQLRDQLGISEEADWPASPTVSNVQHSDVSNVDVPESESPLPDPSTFRDSQQGFTAGNSDAGLGASGGSEETWTVEIETKGDQRVQLDSNRSVLLEQPSSAASEPEYTWIFARELMEDDRFHVIPDHVREELYRDALEKLYEEDLSGPQILDSLQFWHVTMQKIYEEYENIDQIYSLLDRHGIQKSKAAVRDWFRAVVAAEEPIDLVENPDLTIGPDSAADIQVIGKAFDHERFISEANIIQNVMKRFRKENRDRGRKLNEQIAESLGELESEYTQQIVTHEVAKISETSNH